MPTISLGKVALTWRGAYDGTVAYASQDIVSYGGSTYICKQSSTGHAPTESTWWDLLAQGIEGVTANIGELVYFDGAQLQPIPVGNAGDILRIDPNGIPAWLPDQDRSGMRVSWIQDERAQVTYRRGHCVMTDGTCRAWGRGENWLLGQGNTTADRSYPIRVGFPPEAAPVVKMWMQHDYASFAIDADGKFWGWGQNDYGEIGAGNNSDRHIPYCASDNPSNSIYGKTVVDYAPMTSAENYLSAMVLCSDGTVHTCGYNGYGQLGQGDTSNRYNFVQVPLLSDIVQIARGRERYTSCYALKADGSVYAWGYNGDYQLGHSNNTQMNIPMQVMWFVTNAVTVKSIGAAGGNAWAIDTDDNLYTWGYNGYGNLGHSGTSTQSYPIFALQNAAQVVMHGINGDYNSTWVVKTDGSVWAAGANNYGALGVAADTTNRSTFVECKKSDGTGFSNAVKVVKGGTGSYNFATVLDADGICWSVGYSGNGGMGTGNYNGTNYWFQPVLIHRRTVVDLHTVGTGSEGGTMFLMDDGQLFQAGYAGESQLPEDDDESIPVPMPVIF